MTLGLLSVLGVLCFHYPDYLTTPQLREAYSVDQMRYLLGAGMVFSAAFGVVTFALNRHKLMGAIGITLSPLGAMGRRRHDAGRPALRCAGLYRARLGSSST